MSERASVEIKKVHGPLPPGGYGGQSAARFFAKAPVAAATAALAGASDHAVSPSPVTFASSFSLSASLILSRSLSLVRHQCRPSTSHHHHERPALALSPHHEACFRTRHASGEWRVRVSKCKRNSSGVRVLMHDCRITRKPCAACLQIPLHPPLAILSCE